MEDKEERDKDKEERREKAIELAKRVGIIKILRNSKAPDSPNKGREEIIRAALELSKILDEARYAEDDKVRRKARTDWNRACGFGRGPRGRRNKLFHQKWIREIVDARDRGVALSREIEVAGLTGQLVKLNELLEKHPGRPGKETKLREVTLPIEETLSKNDCFILLDYIVELGEYREFGRASRKEPGERIRKLYEGK